METKYNIVKQAIKSKILDGTFQPNQKISSESELMKQFGVSRHTVRLAIGELVNQGWLYREQGAGTFCADRTQAEGVMLNKQKNIAIITSYISDYIFPSIIRGAESYLSEQGYHVSLFSTNNNHSDERKFLERIITQQFDGVIVEPTKSAVPNPNLNYYLNMESNGIPYIMINGYYDEIEPLHIITDDQKGGYLQTKHLLELGHRKILGFFKSDDAQGAKKMKGYIKAHRSLQVPINPKNIITYTTEEKGTKPLNELEYKLSQSGEKPTAIVCYNDELAIQLLEVIRNKNLNIPDDMSMVGYDDSLLAAVTEVKLSTIEHPKSKMGQMAAKMILDLVKHKNESSKSEVDINSIELEPKLIVRNSTKELKT